MQPYFYPYLGYISLIKNVDLFILLDTVQFIRHGWIERNRILKPTNGWQYIRVALQKHHRETLIKDIIINNNDNWKKKIIAQLFHYNKSAPYFTQVIESLNKVFINTYDKITFLNKTALMAVCNYLNIKTPIAIFSDMNIDIEPVNSSDEWALNICKALKNVNEYWNPPGGKLFFNQKKYENNGITLKFHTINKYKYDQKRDRFESDLSIIDVMMFNSIEKINILLSEYQLS